MNMTTIFFTEHNQCVHETKLLQNILWFESEAILFKAYSETIIERKSFF